MAGNDNVLGAPTEGLGQTVTFGGFDEKSGVPVLQPDSVVQTRGGVRGGETAAVRVTGGGNERYEGSGALDMLIKLGDRKLQGQIKQRQQEQFVVGMQRAMAGEAVADIAEDQPWYSQLFGDSDVIEGARAYSSQAAVSDMAASFEASADDMRRLGPQEAQQFYIAEVNKRLTGDPASDGAIMQAVMRVMPSAMKSQAKAHYGFLQERAVEAQSQAMSSDADRLQANGAALAKGTMSAEDFAVAKEQVVFNGQPAAGQNPEKWVETIGKNLHLWASQGKFHAVNAYKEKGAFDVLPPALRESVEKAVYSGESKALDKARGAHAAALGQIDFRAHEGKTTDEEILSAYQAVNALVAKETGITSQDAISASTLQAGVKNALTSMLREQDQRIRGAKTAGSSARTAIEKAALKAEVIEGTASMIKLGKGLGVNISRDDAIEAWDHIRKTESPQAVMELQARNFRTFNGRNGPVVDEKAQAITKMRLQGAIENQDVATFTEVYRDWNARRTINPAMANEYIGDSRLALQMESFHQIMGGRDERAIPAFGKAFVTDPRPVSMSKEDRTAAVKALKAETSYYVPEGFGARGTPDGRGVYSNNIDLADHQLAILEQAVLPRLAELRGVNPGATAKQALQERMADGSLSVLGGYVVQNLKGQKPLDAVMIARGVPVDNINTAFQELTHQKLQALGLSDGDSVSYWRGPDMPGGDPAFVAVVGDGSTFHTMVLTGDEITKHAKTTAARIAADKANPKAVELRKALVKSKEQSKAATNFGAIP